MSFPAADGFAQWEEHGGAETEFCALHGIRKADLRRYVKAAAKQRKVMSGMSAKEKQKHMKQRSAGSGPKDFVITVSVSSEYSSSTNNNNNPSKRGTKPMDAELLAYVTLYRGSAPEGHQHHVVTNELEQGGKRLSLNYLAVSNLLATS